MNDHPSEDVLSGYVLDPSLVTGREQLENHLDACMRCREHVDAIRAFDAALKDEDSWPEESADLNALLRQDAIARRENEEADQSLRPFLTGSSGSLAWANLAEKPKYHTGGVVRRLTAEADTASYNQPLHALLLADTAIAIASALPHERYTIPELASWRGTAWWIRANALRHLGRYPGAFESLDVAERFYRMLPRPELDLAQVTFTRAAILCEQGEYARADELAAISTREFSQLGQTDLYLKGRLLQGWIAFERRHLATAEEIFREIHVHGEATGSTKWIARASQALGNCFVESGAFDHAVQHLMTALRLFAEQGLLVEEIRCRWGIARVAQKSGNHEAAVSRLRAVRDEFAKMRVRTDAALVTLDLMETYLAMRRWRDVRAAAGNVVELFREAGMVTGALTAANWLRHAARMRTVTPPVLDYLRSYFKRVDLQPDFAFVPPSPAGL